MVARLSQRGRTAGGRGDESYSKVSNYSISVPVTNNGLTETQQKVIDTYVDDAHGEVGFVRAVQNGKNIGVDQEKYKKMGEIIEQLISENREENDIIYRGIKATNKDMKQYRPGAVIDQRGMSSWSGTNGVALDYAVRRDILGNNVMFVATGTKNAAPIGRFSSLPEDEWLYSKNQKFVVANLYSMTYEGQKVTVVHVREA